MGVVGVVLGLLFCFLIIEVFVVSVVFVEMGVLFVVSVCIIVSYLFYSFLDVVGEFIFIFGRLGVVGG